MLFENVKVGDLVIEHSRWGGVYTISKVTNVTPKYLDVGGSRYRRSDGRLPGDSWSSSRVIPSTPELIAEIERETKILTLRRKLSKYFRNPNTWNLSIEQMDQILAIIGKKEGE